MKVGILFDLDGTLLNTLQDLADSTNYALKQYGCPERTVEEIRRFIGTGAYRLIAQALPGKENDPPVEEVLATYQAYYKLHARDKTAPYDGVMKAVAEIAGKYPVAIVSNKPDAAVKILCADYFPGIYARGESTDCPRKPAPDMLYKALKEIGAEKCVYVGDSEVDAITAGNAGAPCLSVLWGFRDREEIAANGGKHFCSEAKDMPAMIDAIVEEYYG